MNSRQRRKQAANEHNDRIGLMQEISGLQTAIRSKHGVRVRAVICGDNSSVLMEIARLRGILASDTPPRSAKRGIGVSVTLLALAALAGIGSGSK